MTYVEQEMRQAIDQHREHGMTPEIREQFEWLSSEWLITQTELEMRDEMRRLLA